MNEAEVQARLDAIRALADEGDDEESHAAEDELHEDVLQTIAHGAKNPRTLAFLALKTRDFDFCRWYA